jgi:hypothetical protein
MQSVSVLVYNLINSIALHLSEERHIKKRILIKDNQRSTIGHHLTIYDSNGNRKDRLKAVYGHFSTSKSNKLVDFYDY